MSEKEGPYKFTASQKAAMYVTTVSLIAFVYLAPDIFKFLSSLSEAAWKAIMIALLAAVVAGAGVGAYAIWSVFSTAKLGIRKGTENERAERMVKGRK